jgi:hypothetical protein
LKRRPAKHNQGFDGSTSVTEKAVNFKIGVQRVRLNLCKSGFGAAHGARVYWLEHRRIGPEWPSQERKSNCRCIVAFRDIADFSDAEPTSDAFALSEFHPQPPLPGKFLILPRKMIIFGAGCLRLAAPSILG